MTTISKIIENAFDGSKNSMMMLHNYIQKNDLSALEVQSVKIAFSKLLREKESKNCESMIETLQIYIQKNHEQLGDWLYVILQQIVRRLSVATNENHIDLLQETGDLVRSLFSHSLLLQLCCKFVMDTNKVAQPSVKFHLLEFIRHIIVSSKFDFMNHLSSEFMMAISRIVSWSADVNSVKVRKESNRIIQKLYNMNLEKFTELVKPLPTIFHDRIRLILDNPSAFDKYLNFLKAEDQSKVIPMSPNSEDSSRAILSSNSLFEKQSVNNSESSPDKKSKKQEKLIINGGTVTYADKLHIQSSLRKMHKNKRLEQSVPPNECRKDELENTTKHLNSSNKTDRKSRSKKKHSKSHLATLNSVESVFINKLMNVVQESKHAKHQKSLENIIETEFEMDVNDIIQKLSCYTNRNQDQKMIMIYFIKALHNNKSIDWDTHFKFIIFTLINKLHSGEGGIRKLAIICIQELSKAQPQRFQDHMYTLVETLLQYYSDMDTGVIEAVQSCAYTFSKTLNIDSLWRTVNLIIVDDTKELQLSGLRFLRSIIRSASSVIVSIFMVETLSLLNQLSTHNRLQIRKWCVFCLISIYSKIGDRLFPHLKDFDEAKVKLLKLYIGRLK